VSAVCDPHSNADTDGDYRDDDSADAAHDQADAGDHNGDSNGEQRDQAAPPRQSPIVEPLHEGGILGPQLRLNSAELSLLGLT
jgi:hypothetical protein